VRLTAARREKFPLPCCGRLPAASGAAEMSIVFLLLTSAAAGDEDLWLEVDAAAFDIVAYMVAVFLGGEPRDSEFAAVDAQPRNVHGFRRCGIRDLNDLLKVFVGLSLSRARISQERRYANPLLFQSSF
jgi:hypothetical protein